MQSVKSPVCLLEIRLVLHAVLVFILFFLIKKRTDLNTYSTEKTFVKKHACDKSSMKLHSLGALQPFQFAC